MEVANLDKYFENIARTSVTKDMGKVTLVRGFMLKGVVPGACVGSLCLVYSSSGMDHFLAEVVGFEDKYVLMVPLEEMRGVGLGSRILLLKNSSRVHVSPKLLGRVIDGMGRPLDGKPEINTSYDLDIYGQKTNPLDRPPIAEPLSLGVRAIDGLITVGRGQRVGIMAGSGVGKSVLLGMMAKNSDADVNVIALIGERGREVREFIEHNLGEEGLKKSVVIVATSDQSPLLRTRGAFVATTIAEYFSRQGKDVLFMMDSVTRFAMAQREIGLSAGEPPASKGYTPSVFALLPKLLERAGTFDNAGSITGLYTVLVEGDDMDDPIGDSVRSIVDGHIVLSRKLAHRGHYPAIDILQSTSRVMRNVTSKEHQQIAQWVKENMSVYNESEDMINIGAYKEGVNQQIDQAVKSHPAIINYLRQSFDESTSFNDSMEWMKSLIG